MNTIAARYELTELGYDVLPVPAGRKEPNLMNWQHRPPAELWRTAPADSNLALRHGGALRLASIEAERGRPDVAETLRRYLVGLGYYWHAYPATSTAHAGERYFFALLDAPAGESYRKMKADMGGGEFRYGPGAYALVPPSVAEGGRYELIGGAWDGALPRLKWCEIADLLANPDRPPPAAVMPTSAALPDAANLPGDVMRRLEGIGGGDYNSQDDFATVYRLAGLGYGLDEITMLLLAYPGYGHVSELCARNPQAAAAWLAEAYAKALAYLATHGDAAAKMQKLAAAAQVAPWPGRTGAYDRAVYLAHLGIGIDAGAPEWAGGVRRLAEHANVSRHAAGKATGRLVTKDFLRLVKPATPSLAATYTLPTEEPEKNVCAQTNETYPLLSGGYIKKWVGFARLRALPDAFCWHGLGLAAFTIYDALAAADEPQEDTDIVASSGRCLGTVRRLLAKMADLGLVVCHPAGWLATGRAGPSLTPAGQAVWDALAGADGPQAVKVLAASSGRCLGTVRRHLGALDALGMAMYTPGGWAVTEKSLDSVAADLGVLGKRAERRRRHLFERQRQRDHLDFYRTHPIPRRSREKRT